MHTPPDPEQEQTAAAVSRWARVFSEQEWRGAFGELASSYYYCAYAWWRRSGLTPPRAAEATVNSFTHWLNEGRPLREDPGSSQMREWMPARLGELEESGVSFDPERPPFLEIDSAWAESHYADEPPGEAGPIFQRRWALTVLEFTVATMRAEYAARGDEVLFAELVPFAGYDTGGEDRYAEAAKRASRTLGAMHKEVFDFRQRQRELLLYFAGDTLLDPAGAANEITALLLACDAPGLDAANARHPSAIGNVRPDEMLARAMQSVRMTGSGAVGWQPPTVEEASRLFPQYEISALLGRGGMGAVYQGRQVELDRLVAIKLLPLEVSVDRDFADRFRREARAMARLQHPNIIDVHDFGTTGEGHLFFVMEYVDGVDLHSMIRGPGLEPVQALEIIGRVCDALAYAHEEGVVHRDIKPANVMVSRKGKVKVADFGLARLNDAGPEALGHTVTGTVMGTPDYMAPEQKRGMSVDHRADIYSLGVMLYEMLCREVPQGIFDPPSHRVAVDTLVDQVVIRAMQQQPERRFQSTQEMRAALDEASAPRPLAIVDPKSPLVRLPPGGMSRAMTMFSAPTGSKSRVPLFAGIGILALAAALFFLQPWKKSSVTQAQSTPSPTVAMQAATPAGEPQGPAHPGGQHHPPGGAWHPLFTEAEWSQTVPGRRELVEGRLHLNSQQIWKPQPSADGAIRARIQNRGKTNVGLNARVAEDGRRYKLQFENGNQVNLLYIGPGTGAATSANTRHLGKFTLPKPLEPHGSMQLELRLHGDHLTALLDGEVVIQAQDSSSPGPGEWGIVGEDDWFESVEVQAPPGAPPPRGGSNSPPPPPGSGAEGRGGPGRPGNPEGPAPLDR
jgi:serine/threonine protein kinase